MEAGGRGRGWRDERLWVERVKVSTQYCGTQYSEKVLTGGHHYKWALEHGLSTEIGMLINNDIHLFIDILS